MSPKVKIAQIVSKDDIVAEANAKQNFYFEIRHYSDPLNLNEWLVKR